LIYTKEDKYVQNSFGEPPFLRVDTRRVPCAFVSRPGAGRRKWRLYPPPPYGGVTVAAKETAKSDDAVFVPVASIPAPRETAEHISQEQMTERGDTTLFEAIRWVPGIAINGGHPGKDLGGFSLRGYGGGQHGGDFLSIFADGVPLIEGYDGRIDYAAILTGDLESIDIAKGYSSVLLGPNNVGGALLLRTAKPKKLFEASARTVFNLDGGGFGGNVDTVSVGSRFNIFYARAGFQGNFVDHWRLPDSFEPADDKPPEEGGNPQKKGNRIFSESTTLGANLMVGVNPVDDLDIWATYSFSNKDKDWNPVSVKGVVTATGGYGTTPPANTIGDASYIMWSWPYERRHSTALHAEYIQDLFNVKLLGYFDKYDERQLSTSGSGRERWNNYLSETYSAVTDSDRYTLGVNLDGGYKINDWNSIQASFQFRQVSSVKYTNPGSNPDHEERWRSEDFKDNIWFAGAEYTVSPFKPFTAIAGFGLDIMDPQKLERANVNAAGRTITYTALAEKSVGPQWGLGLFYDLTENHELHLTYAKKNRFPSFHEKADSQGIEPGSATGSAPRKANFDLKPVEIHHLEFGFKGYFMDSIRVTSAVFSNFERNRIASVAIVDPTYTTQNQNIDEINYYGFEYGMEMFLNKYFTIGGAMGINKYNILHSEADIKYLGSTPELTASGYFIITPFEGIDTKAVKNIRIIPRFEYYASKYVDAYSGIKTDAAREYIDDYAVIHINTSADIGKYFNASFAINNLLDELYYTLKDNPSPGRSFTLSLGAKF
jgi:iron complex outermembrane receptor protein